MAQIIKLESGQYLNLDHFIYTTTYEDGVVDAILTHGLIELSAKDLEKIDQIANPPRMKGPESRRPV